MKNAGMHGFRRLQCKRMLTRLEPTFEAEIRLRAVPSWQQGSQAAKDSRSACKTAAGRPITAPSRVLPAFSEHPSLWRTFLQLYRSVRKAQSNRHVCQRAASTVACYSMLP